MDLVLNSPYVPPGAKSKRKNWHLKPAEVPQPVVRSLLPEYLPPVVYEASKLTHNGVVGYKCFENCARKHNRNSLSNLLSSFKSSNETFDWLVCQYYACSNDCDRKLINNQAISMLDQISFDQYLSKTRQVRHLNAAQSRKVRSMADKLAFYSANRKFKSKKSGSYNFRVAFLTLTAPEGSEPAQILKAFDRFLNYLQRTANCFYVWKKELGEESFHLHFHVIINNFIPYYIIDWKWKRCLLAEGVIFPVGKNGKESQSHYRIELPRSKKEVSHYISKYLSKAYDLPGKYGYISGHSSILNKLKEVTVYTGEGFEEEIIKLKAVGKTIRHEYVTVIYANLLEIKVQFPKLHAVFEEQYLRFSQVLTLPQRFFEV